MKLSSEIHPVRALTIYYMALLAMPVDILFFVKGIERENYFAAGANLLALMCVCFVWYTCRKGMLTNRLVYLAAAFFYVMLTAIIFLDKESIIDAMWIMAAPPMAVFCLGTKPGALLGLLFLPILVLSLLYTDTIPLAVLSMEFREMYIVTYLLVLIVATVSSWVSDAHLHDLMQARTRIENLEMLIPMCMYCKKVRVDEEWDEVENYIMKHAEVQVSHGLCEACERLHYRDLIVDSKSTQAE